MSIRRRILKILVVFAGVVAPLLLPSFEANAADSSRCLPRFNSTTKLKISKHDKQKRQNFIKYFWPLALEIEETCGIPAKVSMAQSILETNWGTSGGFQKGQNAFGLGTTHKYPSIYASAKAYCFYLTKSSATKHAYKSLRTIVSNGQLNGDQKALKVIDSLKSYAANQRYVSILKVIVKKNLAKNKLPEGPLCAATPNAQTLASVTFRNPQRKKWSWNIQFPSVKSTSAASTSVPAPSTPAEGNQ